MFTVVGVRCITNAGESGQTPAEATVIVDALNDAGEHIYCIRTRVSEFNDTQVFIGGDEMYDLFESGSFTYEEMEEASSMAIEYSEGEIAEGAEDAKYADLNAYSAKLMEEFLETGKCAVEIGQVLD